jgi:16S rRNA (cytidine1402-2'-O)-methyltransferase
LLIAATPIGNPDDASPRLRHALATADVVAAEDTRRVRRLARDLGVSIGGRVVAVYDAVEHGRAAGLVEQLLEGTTVLLVSDAGMPVVSDPGHVLVRTAVAAGVVVTALPGPSAVTTAVALSGLAVERFCFEGFLPRKAGERRTRVRELARDSRALVVFEAPHRLAATLRDLAAGFGGERRAAACRELSKTYEQVRRGTLDELVEWATDEAPRGEITLVVEGATDRPDPAEPARLARAVAERMAAGESRRDAVDAVATLEALPRRVVYDASLRH